MGLQLGNNLKKVWIVLSSIILILALFIIAILFFATQNLPYDEVAKEVNIGSHLKSKPPQTSLFNPHTLLDKAVFNLGGVLYSENGYFYRGLKSRHFQDHLNAVKVQIPDKLTEGQFELKAETLEGEMNPAFRVYHWYSDRAPTIIYNHGASQVPFDAIFTAIFDAETIQRPLKVNLIVVRTPFHRKGRWEFVAASSTLSRFLSILAVSTRVTEKLVQAARRSGSQTIEVAGISNGGFVANLHHTFYNSATYYVPVVAGTAYDRVFLDTLKADSLPLKHPEILRKHLNFADKWNKTDHKNVFPILGRYDGACILQVQGPSYGNLKVEIWDTGHITTATSVRALRYALLRHLISEEDLEPLK